MPENAAHTHLSTARREASPRVLFPSGAVLGAFCLSQFTHKRTLPKNANQMKNTTKPNLFSCQRDHQGLHIRHEYPHPPSARLACPKNRREPERKGRFQGFRWRSTIEKS